jgi:prepilin-type processing-associated H-X9-DG protein
MTAITTQVAVFLCPSDPNPGTITPVDFSDVGGKSGMPASFNYPYNSGLDRVTNNWTADGPYYVGSDWETYPTIKISTFTDGTSNTAIYSEWVKGPGMTPGPDGLGMVYVGQDSNVIDPSKGAIAASYAESLLCQASTTQQWGEKGSWWIYGGTSIYSHTILPNMKACDHLDDSHQDVRGSVTTVNASSYHPGGVNVVFADGSVRFIKSSINYLTWYALATANGGEIVSSDQY